MIEAIREYVDGGFDHIVLRQIGPELGGFLEFFEQELRTRLEALES